MAGREQDVKRVALTVARLALPCVPGRAKRVESLRDAGSSSRRGRCRGSASTDDQAQAIPRARSVRPWPV